MIVIALAVFILSFTGSFIFAGFETGLVSVNSVKVQFASKEKRFGAVSLAALLVMQSRVVATVLIGNNVALVGMQSSFETLMSSLFCIVSPEVITAMLTVVALIFCELLPKSLFRIYSFKMSLFFAPLIRFLNTLFAPLTKVFDLVNAISGAGAEKVVTSELHAIATEGGRNRELSPMVAHLSEVLFRTSIEGVEGLLDGIPECSSHTLEGFVEITDVKSVGELFKDGTLLGENKEIIVKSDSRVRRYCSRDILESILYVK